MRKIRTLIKSNNDAGNTMIETLVSFVILLIVMAALYAMVLFSTNLRMRAIDTATISGKEIFIVKDFTASYTVNVKQNANIVINLNGCNVQLGNTFTNNGTLKLYDTIEADDTHQIVEKGSIATAKTIDNKGTMNIDDTLKVLH